MRTLTQRYAVAFVAMAAVTPLALYLQYSVPPPSDIGPISAALPRVLGKWTAVGPDGSGTPEEREILQTDAIFSRAFACGELFRCELSIVYAQDNPNAVHPPELCYTGGGWTETVRDRAALDVGGAPFEVNRRLFHRSGERRLWVLYWYKAGARSTASYLSFQWAALKARLLRRGCSCSLIQVRAEFDKLDYESEVLAELKKFAAVAIPAVNAAVP